MLDKANTEAPSSKEQSALEKATGQNPETESKLGSKQNIQQPDKKISVAELIQFSMKNAEQITTVKVDLEKLYAHEANLKRRILEIRQILKPVSRNRKKLHTTESTPSIPPREKKVQKAERDDIDDQLFSLHEEIVAQEAELSRLTGKSSDFSKQSKIRSKANGRDYTKRNKHLIKAKMLKAINTFRQTSDSELISNIRVLARATDPDGMKLFKQEFGGVLEAIDVETYILCSGLLSDVLYNAARLTILSKSASFKGDFEELVMPEAE